MISLVLFFAMWPFGHKTAKQPIITPDGCEVQDGLYWFTAEDGVIAFSGAGCDAAKSNTVTARDLNQWKMSRI